MPTRYIFRLALGALACSGAVYAQYKSGPAGPPPSEVGPRISQALQKDGAKIAGAAGAYAEIWLRSDKPSGAKTSDEGVTLPGIPVGALLGVIRFDTKGSDRRGQNIKPGVYTLRYGLMPVNGDHQGAAPQRDFLVLSPAADDQDLNAAPNFDALMVMSRKASGTPHPAVLSFSKADTDSAAGFAKQGDDWVLQTKLGDTAIAIIVIGTAAS